jgi:hypothetical protein
VVAGGAGARAAGEQLFSGVGERTQPWTAGRHTDQPINQTPDTLNYLESVKRIIRPLTEARYNRDFGFGNIRDEYIRHEAMDSSYIRPHSGPWELVYAATRAGILSDAQATQWGLRYLTPHDANIPALVSGNGVLPANRENDRGKGAEYLKASKMHLLGELINDATPNQLQQMRGFMHEARTRFFGMTVAVEGERAGWGDPEGQRLYTAHTRNNPTQGWLNRANASFAHYYPEAMQRAVHQAQAQPRPQHIAAAEEPSLFSSITSAACAFTGFFCPTTAQNAPRRPNGRS